MNRVIARLHTVDIERAGLSDYGKAGNYFERQIGRWSKQYRASETEPVDAMNRLIDWLPAHIPPGDETTVVHGDYRMDNLIFHPSEADASSRSSTGNCRRSGIRSPISPITA